jgi:hypothetical protein
MKEAFAADSKDVAINKKINMNSNGFYARAYDV